MSEPIQPALTPEEWKEREVESQYGNARTSFYVDHKGRIFVSDESPGGEEQSIVLNGPDDRIRHAIAALCLYGQPYGFTQEDVDFLAEEIGGEWDRLSRAQYAAREKRMRRLIARIAALLPPTP